MATMENFHCAASSSSASAASASGGGGGGMELSFAVLGSHDSASERERESPGVRVKLRGKLHSKG